MTYFRRRQRRIGNRLYVATTGNDTTGTGSRAAPYKTIAKASTVATAGTTVVVSPGTYANVYMLAATGGGTSTNPVTYMSSVKWGAVISASASGGTPAEAAWYIGDENSSSTSHPDHIRVVGFEITAPSAKHGIKVDANDVWVIDCHVHDVNTGPTTDDNGGGLLLQGYVNNGSGVGYNGTGNAAIGNWVHAVGKSGNTLTHPIYVACPGAYVANNVCYDTGGWGIHFYHGPNGGKAVNNTVFNCGAPTKGGILFGDGPEVHTTSGYVGNNVIMGCPKAMSEAGSGIAGVQWRNNAVYNCTTVDDTWDHDITGTVTANPHLINYQSGGAGDYRPDIATSPLVAAGSQTNAPGEDYTRIGRGRPPDIGAFSAAVNTVSSAMPTKVAGAYWPHWETTYPDAIHSGINTLFLAFAINNGANGSVQWAGLNTLNQSTFQASVQTTRAAGRCCILSIGGAGITFSIDNSTEVTNFVNSIKSLYTTWGGFDGIDWDIEGGQVTSGNRANFAAASRELKDFYGPDFAISMSYVGTDTQYKTLASELESTGDLDWASIQYYDYGDGTGGNPYPVTSHVTSRLAEMVGTYGVDPTHLGIGTKTEAGNPQTWTTSNIVSMWNTEEATYPTLRGITHWETIIDRVDNGNAFATTVSTAILT